jgi:microsomal dipeptidase-like Zn-dependent dipeptidase
MRGLLVTIGLGLVAAAVALVLLPAEIDARLNTVDRAVLPEPSAQAQALHQRLRVVDLHNDLLLWQRAPLARSSSGHTDLPRLLDGRVGLQVFAATTKVPAGQNFERNRADSFDMITLLVAVQRWPPATWWSLRARALHIASRLARASEASQGRLLRILDVEDLAELVDQLDRGEQVVGGLLGAEGMHSLEGDVANVDALFAAGYRMLAPTNFFDNDIAGSAHGVDKGGLTELGARAIQRMQQLGMAIDVAHASPATVRDILALASRPIVVSHVGVQATCPGPRNLSDAQIDAIAANGGLIGIGFFAGAVCDISPDGIALAARYVAERVGSQHVALGSDWDGSTRVVVDPPRLVHLTDALLRAGFAEDEVIDVMGENALRILAAILPRS